jgi:peptidoglycan hydrolase FlgJ
MSDFAISSMMPGSTTPGGSLASGTATGGAKSAARDPEKARDAAQQFEALLIGQMMRGVRQSGSGWLGSDADASGECATDYGEQQFAAVMAKQGGLGLADMISKGLSKGE